MNTGIQDALNLGWKLAFAATATNRDVLLDSYEHERRPVARQMLALTHLVFWAESGSGTVPTLLRQVLAPLAAPALPLLLARRRLMAELVRSVSQLRVTYRDSPLSEDFKKTAWPHSGPRAGDRLPDATVIAGGQRIPLHALLAGPGVHILSHQAASELDQLAASERYTTVHRLTSVPAGQLVAVRPDGYIGFSGHIADLTQLRAWLCRIGVGRNAGVTGGSP